MLLQLVEIYHRILIPGRIQHAHHFLWGNLDTNRNHYVYVKTVLTFGDNPDPAMAQMPLRKTVEQEVDVYPEAVEP